MARAGGGGVGVPNGLARQIKDTARGRWAEILSSVAGLSIEILDGQHRPCPKCGGTDRFRFTDQGGDGSLICNQCARRSCGDGISSVAWATGWTFPEVVRHLAEHLGIPIKATSIQRGGNSRPEYRPARQSAPANLQIPAAPPPDPAKDLTPLPWSDALVVLWCLRKPPVTPAAVTAAHSRLCRYRRYTVLDFPVIGQGGEAVGHCVYNVTGGTLPKFIKGPDGKLQPAGQIKVKLTWGSKAGWIGNVDQLSQASVVWKLEGPSDVLALLSAADLPPDIAVLTNAMGCGETPIKWMLQSLAGKTVYVVGDADKPGQEGSSAWAGAIATTAAECRLVKLPYEIEESHGKDLRDWLTEGSTFAELDILAKQAEIIQPRQIADGREVNEADDDPHRLARINLEQYATKTGRTLKKWRAEWYTWKGDCYRHISEDEFRAKVSAVIKREFDRLNLEHQEAWESGVDAGLIDPSDGPPKAKKVTPALVNSVLDATGSMVYVPDAVELGTWLLTKERKNWLSLKNGILDIDKVLANASVEDCWIPNSPDWFSTVSLPYEFDLTAKCEHFERVMEHNLNMDPEKFKVLQEWAGYVLLPDMGEQRFLILEGEGNNGKSVYTAAVTAMLGEENVSTVGLEVFGERFDKTSTLGKLLNAAGDCGELDKVAEGYIKPFTSGDRMFFDRKGVPGINCRPTARLQVACNQRPPFKDRSRGIWRRMLLIKFEVEISREERIRGMDSVEYWIKLGELPGILNWALRGLARLRSQRGFTDCESMRVEIEDYKEEANPARAFLSEHVEESGSDSIPTKILYKFYKIWVDENGYRPLSEKSFGREVRRRFPKCEKIRIGGREQRFSAYCGVKFSQDEICEIKVQSELF